MGLLGLFTSEPETTNFIELQTPIIRTESYNKTEARPKLELNFGLSTKKTTYEREAYTLFILLGDVGGFNGAIITLPVIIMSTYSARMYEQSIASELPARRRRKGKKSK